MKGGIAGRAQFAVAVGLALLLAACRSDNGDGLSDQQHERIEVMANAYKGDLRYGSAYAALDPTASTVTLGAAAAFSSTDEFAGLVRAPGHEEVFYTCSACHSLQLVMQQRKSMQGWNDTIDLMIKKRGMPPPPADDRAKITAYLGSYFGLQPQPAGPSPNAAAPAVAKQGI